MRARTDLFTPSASADTRMPLSLPIANGASPQPDGQQLDTNARKFPRTTGLEEP